MIKRFCEKCSAQASDPVSCATLKIGERVEFQMRCIFELVEEPAPCGSLGLSSPRISTADICVSCQIELLETLRRKIAKKVEEKQ